jgi:hypothetical protein
VTRLAGLNDGWLADPRELVSAEAIAHYSGLQSGAVPYVRAVKTASGATADQMRTKLSQVRAIALVVDALPHDAVPDLSELRPWA